MNQRIGWLGLNGVQLIVPTCTVLTATDRNSLQKQIYHSPPEEALLLACGVQYKIYAHQDPIINYIYIKL